MKIRQIIFLAGLILTCMQSIQGQTVYMNTQWDIFKFTGGLGESHRMIIDNGCGPDSSLLSIAIHKDTLYYNTWNGELKRFKIGHPGSCEILLEDGFAYNSMTIDKDGMIYVAADNVVRYNPYTNEMTELGQIPFVSSGDMIFFRGKLLLAGWDAEDWSSGIYEINLQHTSSSKLYMETPSFYGLLSLPVACSTSRYFGLYPGDDNTRLVELDLVEKKILGITDSIPCNIFDGASVTEAGVDNKIHITTAQAINPANCAGDNGSISLSAQSLHAPLTFTLLNTGITGSSGKFDHLSGGMYRFRITDTLGCSADTTVALAAGIPLPSCNELYIPNAFTPNNDGKNDYFGFTIPPHYKNINLQIFGRWGNLVYASKAYTVSWDGSSRGAKQPSGVYIYTFSWTDADGITQSLKGTLTLIR